MKTEKLKSEYGNQNSYYGKAKINYLDNGTKELISYKTKVAIITKGGNFIRLWDGYSLTTMNHINEFRMQNGLSKINKAEWMKIPVNNNHSKKLRLKLHDEEDKKVEIFELNQIDNAIGRLEKRAKMNFFRWDYESIHEVFKNQNEGDSVEFGNIILEIVRC